MNTKICTRCKQELVANEKNFTKASKGKYGLNSKCNPCCKIIRSENSEANKKRKKLYYQKNKEEINAKSKLYYEENKESVRALNKKYAEKNRDKQREYMVDYYKNNKDELKKKTADWRKENPERASKITKKCQMENKEKYSITHSRWCRSNPEKQARYAQVRRARKRSLPSHYTELEWEKCKQYFDHECAYCGNKVKLEQEHFLPLSMSGEYTRENIIPACKSCNSGKRDRNFFEWYPRQEYYSPARERKILKYLNYHNNVQQLSIL